MHGRESDIDSHIKDVDVVLNYACFFKLPMLAGVAANTASSQWTGRRD